MTLGRTSAGKIKIKTDSPKGLRAVSCGCCGNCLFDAFSPTPTPIEGAQKFKYLTYEYNLPLYDLGSLDYGRESWRLECAPYTTEDGGTDYTCMPVSNAQREERQKASHKVTQFLRVVPNVTYPDGSRVCNAHIVKAQGIHERTFNSLQDAEGGACWWSFGPPCWTPGSYRAWTAAIKDADWTTWQDPDTMQLYLDERTSEAKWESSFCEGWDWSYWDGYVTNLTECPSGNIGAVWWGHGAGWNYSSPLEGGGFKVREGSGTYQLVEFDAGAASIFHEIPFTLRQTLHNNLQEIWGPNQLEMRP